MHLTVHEGQELGQIDSARAIGISLVDRILQLGRVLAHGAHDGAKLPGGDGKTNLISQIPRLIPELRAESRLHDRRKEIAFREWVYLKNNHNEAWNTLKPD